MFIVCRLCLKLIISKINKTKMKKTFHIRQCSAMIHDVYSSIISYFFQFMFFLQVNFINIYNLMRDSLTCIIPKTIFCTLINEKLKIQITKQKTERLSSDKLTLTLDIEKFHLHKSMFESASDINFIRVTPAYIDIFVRYQVGPDM